MQSSTPRHNFPFITAAQAQKHVTHNEALVILDQLVHLQIDSIPSMPPNVLIEQTFYLIKTQMKMDRGPV